MPYAIAHEKSDAALMTNRRQSPSSPMKMHPIIANMGEFVKDAALRADTQSDVARASVTMGAPTPNITAQKAIIMTK